MKTVKPQIYILAEIECCEEGCTSTFAVRLPVYVHSFAGFAIPCAVSPPSGWCAVPSRSMFSASEPDLKRPLQPLVEIDYYCPAHSARSTEAEVEVEVEAVRAEAERLREGVLHK